MPVRQSNATCSSASVRSEPKPSISVSSVALDDGRFTKTVEPGTRACAPTTTREQALLFTGCWALQPWGTLGAVLGAEDQAVNVTISPWKSLHWHEMCLQWDPSPTPTLVPFPTGAWYLAASTQSSLLGGRCIDLCTVGS
jgi:hypothetical protein